jgi:DNA polymerase III delta prime subunit
MDLQTRTVKLSELQKYVKHHFRTKRPMMVWGPPGIGKSETFQQITDSYVAEGKKAKLIDARLSLWDPTDLKGYPYYNKETNRMSFSSPDELPTEAEAAEYDIIVLFLDELNGAAPATQAAAYQLILNRAIGKYKLPDNVVIAAAGNRETDKGVTYRMPKPLANRFLHYEVRVDFQDWFDWAIKNNQHPDVIGYVTTFKDDLYNFDASSAERSFATPRSWAFISDTIEDVEGFNEEEVTDMVAAGIGEGLALKFKAHRQVAAQLPNPTDILDGKVKELKTDNISAKYSLTTALCYELKDSFDNKKDEMTRFDNFLEFVQNNFEAEMVVMACTIALGKYAIRPKFNQLKNWKGFIAKYGTLIEMA